MEAIYNQVDDDGFDEVVVAGLVFVGTQRATPESVGGTIGGGVSLV